MKNNQKITNLNEKYQEVSEIAIPKVSALHTKLKSDTQELEITNKEISDHIYELGKLKFSKKCIQPKSILENCIDEITKKANKGAFFLKEYINIIENYEPLFIECRKILDNLHTRIKDFQTLYTNILTTVVRSNGLTEFEKKYYKSHFISVPYFKDYLFCAVEDSNITSLKEELSIYQNQEEFSIDNLRKVQEGKFAGQEISAAMIYILKNRKENIKEEYQNMIIQVKKIVQKCSKIIQKQSSIADSIENMTDYEAILDYFNQIYYEVKQFSAPEDRQRIVENFESIMQSFKSDVANINTNIFNPRNMVSEDQPQQKIKIQESEEEKKDKTTEDEKRNEKKDHDRSL